MINESHIFNGIEFNVVTWGNPSKPKLFFLHGWMDMGASFHFTCELLQDDFHCIAPDMRGMGHSQHSPNPLGYFFYEYVADTHALFGHYSPNTPIKLVGHSMGGNVASLYAGTFPERVSDFINVEGFGIQDMPAELGPKRMRNWIEGIGKHTFPVHKSLDDLSERLIKTNPRLSKNRALFLAEHISCKTNEGYQVAGDPRHKQVHPYLFQLKNVVAFWKKIQARCLLISAEKTQMGTWLKAGIDVQAEIKRRHDLFPPSSKSTVIDDCGHMIHHERPEELAQRIRSFLSGRD